MIGILCLCVPAGAGEKSWYAAVEGGAEFDGTLYSPDSGWAALLTVGREVAPHLSLEAELGYRSTSDQDFNNTEIDQTSVMLNVVYDAALSDDLALTLGVGLGGDRVHVELVGLPTVMPYSESEIEVAGQLKIGLSLAVSESTDLIANYRYMELLTDSPVSNSTVSFGIRFAL